MPANLTLESFSDRELLHILNDLAGDEGWVDAEVMGVRMGLSVPGMSEEQTHIHARRCVSVRMSWIKRLSDTVERHPKKSVTHWRLTDAGKAVVKARLTNEFESKLGNIDEFAALAALGTLSRRYMRADVKAANLMRREWAHGTHRNRRG